MSQNSEVSAHPTEIVLDTKEVKAAAETVAKVAPILTTEDRVRAYYRDIPILAEISRCESHFRQTDKSGNILRGKVNSADIGVMQINEYYHLSDAKKLGLDLYSLEGNLEYAKHLYKKQGTQPWSASKACWNK